MAYVRKPHIPWEPSAGENVPDPRPAGATMSMAKLTRG